MNVLARACVCWLVLACFSMTPLKSSFRKYRFGFKFSVIAKLLGIFKIKIVLSSLSHSSILTVLTEYCKLLAYLLICIFIIFKISLLKDKIFLNAISHGLQANFVTLHCRFSSKKNQILCQNPQPAQCIDREYKCFNRL